MHVIATAGHVDHGKSALLRALTGMEPDRLTEEQRRGMTIDLGYAWMELASGDRLAFVDVPGHSRFVSNMLAGVGPVPAVLFVVAADGGWMPQSAEHLAVIDALGISRGVLAVTKSDLADPGPALGQARANIARSSLGAVPAVAVSAATGAGLAELAAELTRLAGSLQEPDPRAPVRVWVDRAFSIAGSGTVVTGTLAAGTLSRGDELLVTPSLRPVRIRGLQSLGASTADLTGVARAALNLRGVDRGELGRGMALVRPGQWTLTRMIDVRITMGERAISSLPRLVMLHIGSARTRATVRLLGGADAGPTGGYTLARLSLRDPLPLHVSDRVLVRDAGAARSAGSGWGTGNAKADEAAGWPGLFGAVVLDVTPPPLVRRGSASAAAAELGRWPDRPAAAHLLRRHRLIRADRMSAMGVTELPEGVAAGWLADPEHWSALASELHRVVTAHAVEHPLAAGMPVDAARTALELPDRKLVAALIAPPVRLQGGLLTVMTLDADSPRLPPRLSEAVAAVLADLSEHPFAAPGVDRLRELGLDGRALAAADRAGALLRITDQIVLAPGAGQRAARLLRRLPQPFTAAEARIALGTTRRTLIPLLEYLDRAGLTRRLQDDRRELTAAGDRASQ